MPSTTHPTEVLVVGAGPVGLALALGLARSGVDCRIIEREPEFRTIGVRGKGVSPRTLEILDDLGVVQQMYARGTHNPKVRTYRGSRLVAEADPAPGNAPTPDRPHRGMLLIPQHHTEAVLRYRLAEYGVKVELDTELLDHEQDADLVRATVRHGERTEVVTARYLVGCDGGRSAVRKLAGIPFHGETWEEERFLLAAMHVDGLDPDCLHLWDHPELGIGALTLVPLRSDGNWAVHAAVTPDAHGELPEPSTATFRRLFAERAGLPGVELRDLVWSSVWRPTVRMVERYRSGRVFLAGDAAHCHSAAGGQGLNTGIQDAHNLSWKLAAALRTTPDSPLDPAALLDSYQAERLPVARAVLAATSAQHRALFTDRGAEAFTRQLVTQSDNAGGDLTGLTINYRGGPLGRDLDDSTGIRAGDRAPDAPCRTADGRDVRLFDLFRGPHSTLLGFGKGAAAALTEASGLPGIRAAAVHDPAGHAHRAYGVTGNAVVLVRPDGYVALTAGAGARALEVARLGAQLRELVG
ncbi:FAD-dependent monooxygenase [Kitasatospora sp. LaBMicrA B282]|uniref:FAD-dependent monooxygenase n=1 Tax=Kitasatospora sp. LaBMicrA B282 TaxID=3420949 RepID=UPI003D0A9851